MANVPTGTLFYLATAYAASKDTTVVTNATEAVVTSAAHGYSNGDMVEITSGWGRLNKRAFKIEGVTTDTFTLSNMDTSDTSVFPAGGGIGTVRKISTFTQLTKVMNPQSQGGDPKSVNYKFVESDVEYSLNDGFSATTYTMEFDDDDTTAGYAALSALTESQADTVLKMRLRNGSEVYLPCRVALNTMPVLQEGQINRVRAVFNGNNRPNRYSA